MRPQLVLTVVGTILLIAVLAANECNKPVKLGDPLPGLSLEEREKFDAGKKLFTRTFVTGNGLGPIFNAPSCVECHEEPTQGGVGDEVEQHIAAVQNDGTCDPLLEFGGPVLQGRVTPLLQAHGNSGETAPPGFTPARRTTPPVFGMGLLDAVPDAELKRLADPDDRDGDGVSGRPAVFRDGLIGRFGRKAQVAHIDEFTEIALLQEQGITSPNLMHELLPGGQQLPDGVDPVEEPEFSAVELAQLNAYMMFLAPPASTWSTSGEYIFTAVGCAKCHVPILRTGESEFTVLNKKKVGAFTDLLLHDMGAEMADVCLGVASPREFRTAPLMGLSFHTSFMHDGRATSIEEAIEAHGGEGAGARKAFRELSHETRVELLKFLGGL